MKRAYDEIMDRLTVSPALRQRLLARMRQTYPSPLRRFRLALPLAACLALVLALWLVLPTLPGTVPWPTPTLGVLGPVSPQTVENSDALAQAVGFPVEEPEALPFTVRETVYTAYPGPMAEIRYVGEAQSLTYRKAAGSGDPLGDYTSYEDVWEMDVNGTTVTLKGDGGLCTLALWEADGYTWSLRCTAPVEQDVLTALAAQLCTPAS